MTNYKCPPTNTSGIANKIRLPNGQPRLNVDLPKTLAKIPGVDSVDLDGAVTVSLAKDSFNNTGTRAEVIAAAWKMASGLNLRFVQNGPYEPQ